MDAQTEQEQGDADQHQERIGYGAQKLDQAVAVWRHLYCPGVQLELPPFFSVAVKVNHEYLAHTF